MNRGISTLLKIIRNASIVIVALMLICASIFIAFPDYILNTFLKDRLTIAITERYPLFSVRIGNMHYNIWKNQLRCDSVVLQTADTLFACSVTSLSLSRIAWLKLLWRKDSASNTLAGSVLDAENIFLHFRPSQNELHIGTVHLSAPDSEMIIDSIRYYSLQVDEEFFAQSRFRQTRFRFDIPRIRIRSLNCFDVLHDNVYKAGSIDIREAFADILVNMDKPYDKKSDAPLMPAEALASIKERVTLDSLKITNGRFKYSERIAVRAKPGVITFHKVNVSALGITNHSALPDTAFIYGEGLLMNSGVMKLFMEIPLTSKELSFRYSGSLGAMAATELNSFLEPNEHRRITSGIVQTATYHVNVVSGRASGAVRSVYKDLAISVLDKKTGSSHGIFNRIASLYAKLFIIHGTNQADTKGVVKIGKIRYRRKSDDYFLQFVWFALRSGVADIVGFTPK